MLRRRATLSAPRRRTGLAALFAVVASVLPLGAAPALAVDVPNGDFTTQYSLQTNGPNGNIGLGDFYTASAGGNQGHLLEIDVPCGWPSTKPIDVDLFSAPVNTSTTYPGAAKYEEPNGSGDATTYVLRRPGGTQVASTTYPPINAAADSWVRFATLAAPVACGTYTLTVTTANDDQNGWRLRVGDDDDVNPNDAPPATGFDDADGIDGTDDELTVGITRGSYQHDRGSPGTPICLVLYEYVAPGLSSVAFQNFDLDNDANPGSTVRYYRPTGALDPTGQSGGILGDISANGVWNNPGGAETLNRVGDRVTAAQAPAPGNPAAVEPGWWRIVTCASDHNQFVQEAQTGEPVYFEQPPTPRLVITKTDGQTVVDPGQTVTYAVTVSNTSSGPTAGAATSVVVTDVLPTGMTPVSCSTSTGEACALSGQTYTATLAGSIAAGASRTVSVVARVAATGAPATLTNAASASFRDSLGNAYVPVSASDTDTLGSADLSITKSAASAFTVGGSASYTLAVASAAGTGRTRARGVTITDTLQTGLSFVSSSGAGWTCSAAGRTVTCTYAPDLAPGASAAVTLNVAVATGAFPSVTNTATVTSSTPDPVAGNGSGSATTPVGAATIGDRVFADADADGVQDAGEAGASGVEVRLLAEDGVTVLATTTTSSSGAYSFTGLSGGTYVVQVVAPAGRLLSPRDAGTDDALDSDADPVTGRTGAVVVSPGQTLSTVDAGLVVPASIGDLVYDDRDGDGQRDAGEPGLAGRTVVLSQGGSTVATTTTDAGGAYLFSGLRPGTYVVTTATPTGFTATGPALSGVSVTVGPGQDDLVRDFGFQQTNASIGDTVYVDADGDATQDAGEPGRAGVTVQLSRGGQPVASVVTGTGGSYLFSGLPAGSYAVTVVPPAGFVATTTNPVAVTLAAGAAVRTADVGLQQRDARIGDLVFTDSNGNGVLDGAETGRAGITLSLSGGPTARPDVVTAADGSYAFTGLAAGTYTVTATPPAGFVGTTPLAQTATVTAGQVVDTVDVGLQQADGSIGDLVFDDRDGNGAFGAGDAPLAGRTVRLEGPGGTRTAVTGTDGRYLFPGLVAGSYTVTVATPTGFTATGPSSSPRQVVLAAGQGVDDADFGFQQTDSSIGDTVFTDLDADGTQGVGEPGRQGVVVELLTATGDTVLRSTTSGPGGAYAFSGLPAGSYRVRVVPPTGFVATTGALVPVTLGRGQALTTVDLGVVQSDASIGDTVFTDLDADGALDGGEPGRSGVVVRLSRDGVLVAQQTTSATGAYAFTGLRAGAYTVTVDVPAGTVATRPLPLAVALSAGEQVTDADVGLATTDGVIGDLVYVDADGDGARDAGEIGLGGRTVTLTRAGQPVATTVTDGAGAYLFTGLVAGSYTVTVATPDGFAPTGDTRSPVTVQLVAGGVRRDVDLGFQQVNASIGDRVWDDRDGDGVQDAGEPGLVGLTVTLDGPGGPRTTTTGVDGAYVFDGLVEGAYTVTVTPPAGFAPTAPLPLQVSLAAGQRLVTADLGLQRRDGSIGDLVFDDRDGDSAPGAGEPGLPGVRVTLTDAAGVVRTATTDADGRYTVPGLPAGTYTVTVEAPTGFVRTTGPVAVELPAGGTSTVADVGLQRRDGAIGDLVFLDLDGDGAPGAGEPGRGGVVVTLTGGPAPVTTTSAFDGSYLFTGLPAGAYVVSISAPAGFVATTGPVAVSLAAGAVVRTADLGLEQAGGTIGDLVYNDRDADGTPDPDEAGYADVRVLLLEAGPDGVLGTGDDVAAGTTTTRPSGTYVFAGLTAGRYRVTFDTATLPGGGATLTATGPTTIDVDLAGDGAITTADVGFVQAGASIGDRVFDDRDGDGARDADEPGLGGVSLLLTGPGLPAEGRTVLSDADGSYVFAGLQAGTFTLTATAPAGSRVTTGDPRSVPVAEDQAVTDADVGVQRTDAGVAGTVFDDRDGDGAQEPGEPGLPGATVTLSGGDLTDPVTVPVAADGSYSFAGRPAGDYTVTVVLPAGYTATTPTSTAVTLRAGEQRTGVDAGARLTTGVVSGTATLDSDGDGVADGPAQGVQVVLTGAGLDGALGTADDTTATALTDGAGGYAFGGLPAGDYLVEATGPVGTTVLSGARTDISLPAGGQRDVDVLVQRVDASIGDLVFTDVDGNGVFDVGTDTGLDGVTVVLDRPTGDDLVAVTSGGGAYLFAGLPAGSYVVDVRVPAGSTATTADPRPVTLAPGQAVTTADFGLRPTSAAVSGTVFTDTGNDGARTGDVGRPAVTVRLTRDGVPVDTTLTDEFGAYAFSGLPAGSYAVTVVPADGTVPSTPVTRPVSLTTVPVAGQDFGLAPAVGTIGDLVFEDPDRDGEQVTGESGRQGATVTLLRGDTVLDEVVSGPGGAYAFTGLPAGSYVVRATPPTGFLLSAGQPATVVLTAAAPSDSTVDVGVVQSDASLGDTVFRDDDGDGLQGAGEPGLAGVQVSLSGGPTAATPVVTDADGRYGFAGLQAGTYTVTAAVPPGLTAVTPLPLAVTVGPGEAVDTADVALRPTPGSVSGLVYDDADADGTRAASGEAGLTGVSVQLRDAAGTVVRATTTGADGSYSFAGLPVGDYTVVFTPLPGTAATGPSARPVTLTTAAPTSPGNDLGLALAAASIGDRVFSDRDGDGRQGTDEPGLGLVTVTLLRGGADVGTAVTSADGSYLFDGLTTGDYTVVVTVPAGSTATTPASLDVALEAAEAVDTADVGVRQTDASIGDLVFDDADGDGLQGAGELGLVGIEIALTGPVRATTTTAAGGRYAFGGLPAGRYTVDVQVPTGRTATTADPRVVDLADGQAVQTADFGLRTTSAAVSGTVFSDVDGDGAEGVGEDGREGTLVVLLVDGVEVARTSTGPDGRYAFTGLPAGSYTVSVPVPAGARATTATAGPVVLTDAPVDGPDVGLQPVLGRIGDRVFDDADGDGVQDLTEGGRGGLGVVLTRGGVEVDTTTTDDLGGYAFTGLAAGTYVITLTVPAGSTASTPTSLTRTVAADGTVDDADFGVRRTGASLTGVVVDDLDRDGSAGTGEPLLPAVLVQLLRGGVVVQEVSSDAVGRYLFTGLAAGSYVVRLVPPAGTAGPADLPVVLTTDQARTGVDLAVRSAAVGDVVFDDLDGDGTQGAGEPGLSGVQVELTRGGGLVASTTTGADGSYLFDRLPAGSYTVTTTVSGDRIATGDGATRAVVLTAGERDLTVDLGQRLVPNTAPRFTAGSPDTNTAQSTTVGGGLVPLRAVDDEGGRLLYEPVLDGGALPPGVSLRDDGALVGTAEQTGTYTFVAEVVDVRGARDRTTLVVTVVAGDRLPVAAADEAGVIAGGSVAVDVLGNDTPGDGITGIRVQTQPGPGQGTATCVLDAAGPDCSYTAPAGFAGTVTFVYEITDADGDTSSAAVTVTVSAAPQDLRPVAVADEATVVAGGTVAIDVLGNDTPGDGITGIRVQTQPGPGQGTATCVLDAAGPDCSYAAPAGFAGTVTFVYEITDADGDTSSAAVTVTVTPAPPADRTPVALDDAAQTTTGTPVDVDVRLNDDQGDAPATAEAVGTPVGGTVACLDGTCTFTPATGFVGEGSFDYVLVDDDGDRSEPASVTVTVTAAPDPDLLPQAVADSATVTAGGTVGVDVLANDGRGDGVTVVRVAEQPGPGQGSATCALAAAGPSCSFEAPPGFAGTVTFVYEITDADGDTSSAVVTVTVEPAPAPGGTAPVAVADSATTTAGVAVPVDVLRNDESGDTPTSVTVVGTPVGGTVSCDGGTCTFTPTDGFTGDGSFTYELRDADDQTSQATVSVRVDPAAPTVDTRPVAVDDRATTPAGTPVGVDVLINDERGDTPTTVTVVGTPVGGTVACTGGTCTFTPANGFSGDGSFVYELRDADGDTSRATVTVTVQPPPAVDRGPVAQPDRSATTSGAPVSIDVLTGDDQGDGPATVTVVGTPVGGTVVCTPQGSCTFTPTPGFVGEGSFSYVLTDADGDVSAPVTVAVAVAAAAPAGPADRTPTGQPDRLSTRAGTPVTVDVRNGDDQGDGPATVAVVGRAVGGTVVCTPQGSCTFTPAPGFVGEGSFSYVLTDVDGDVSAPVPVTVTVTADSGAGAPGPVAPGTPGTGAPDTGGPRGVVTTDGGSGSTGSTSGDRSGGRSGDGGGTGRLPRTGTETAELLTTGAGLLLLGLLLTATGRRRRRA